MANTDSIYDYFTAAAIDASLWDSLATGSCTVTQGSGKVTFTLDGTSGSGFEICTLTSVDTALVSTGHRVFARIATVVNAGAGATGHINIQDNAGGATNLDENQFSCDGNNIYAVTYDSSLDSVTIHATLAYNATTQAWWSIREKDGVTYWEYARATAHDPPWDYEWVELFKIANTITHTACAVNAVGISTGSGTPGIFELESINPRVQRDYGYAIHPKPNIRQLFAGRAK